MSEGKFFVSVGVLFGALVFCGFQCARCTAEEEDVKFKVVRTYTKHESYRVVARVYSGHRTTRETFEIADSLYQWEMDSADRYSRMEPGQCFVADVVGVRAHGISSFRSLHRIQKVACP